MTVNALAQARVLIVDDQEANVILLKRVLEQDGFHNIKTLVDSRQFLNDFQQCQPDLIMLDLMMPHVDGFAILEQLKAMNGLCQAPVLVLTADISQEIKRRALASGAKDFLTKPFDNVEVVLRTKNLLETHFLNQELAQHNQQLEEKVRERTQQVREQASLIDLASDAILVCDFESIVQFWNKGAERIYGWSAAEAVGQSVHALFCRKPLPCLVEYQKVLLAQGEWSGELEQETKDGRTITVLSRWTLVRDAAGQPKAVLVINSDISDKKKLEKEYLRAQRLESIGVLAGGIAHDLNNMLTPMLMGVQFFRMKMTDPGSQTLLKNLEGSVERAADMVKQILTFARGSSGDYQPMQLVHLLKELHKMIKHSFPKEIAIQTNLPKDLWLVAGDSTQLYQVAMNLCVNARDAMPEGGTLTLTAENVLLDSNYVAMNPEAHVGPYVMIKVADTGQGMTPDVLEHIFEPFFTTKEQTKGTGLGLSTVFTLVKKHGGFVKVLTQLKVGTEFAIYLPALQRADVVLTERPAELPQGNGEVVLVVDDEAMVRQITQSTLEANGYRVLTAADGTEAIALYAQKNHDIKGVLLDMKMPFMDGLSTSRVLRNINSSIPIIGFSGIYQPAELGEAGKSFKDFLVKPFTAEKLLVTLQNVFQATYNGDYAACG